MAYIVWPIIAGLALLYLVSNLLVKSSKITLAIQKRIWNIMLILCFSVSVSLGVLMASGIYIENSLFIHVEIGIAFFTIALFHIVWHAYYFKDLFKKKN